jgi:aminopeptidase 2
MDVSASSDERNTALRNLGRTTNAALIQKTLQIALNEVKEQDIYLPFQGSRPS